MSPFQQHADLKNLVDTTFVHAVRTDHNLL